MVALSLNECSALKKSVSVTRTSQVSLHVLNETIKDFLLCKYPNVTMVHVSIKVTFSGTSYAPGMLLCHGSTAGLPDFAEVSQIILVLDSIFFVVKLLNAWYNEHLRSYELDYTGNIQVIEPKELLDFYPLAMYTVAGRRVVTLKHHITIPF